MAKSIRDRGQNIYYHVYGDTTKDLIILVHSAFSDHLCFEYQIESFAKDHCVICPDLVGHGESQVEDGKVKINNSAFHIAEIMEKEGFGQAHLIGVSLGGLIVQYFSLNYPEKTKSLTLLGAYDINGNDSRFSKSHSSLGLALKALFSMDSFRRSVAGLSCINPDGRERFVRSAEHFKRKSFTAMTGLNRIVKPRENITLGFPLLILCGDQDIPLAFEASESLKNRYPQGEYIIIEKAGHCANLDNPVRFNEAVLNFIKHIEPAIPTQ